MNDRSIRPARLQRLIGAIVLTLSAAGCAIPTRVASVSTDIPRELTPVAIDSGLKALDDAETKRRIERMLASPEMRAVQRELVVGMVDGSLSALSDQERVDRIGALSSRYMAGMLRGFSKDVAPEIGPAASAAMRGAIQGAMGEALSAPHQAELRHLVSSLAQESVQPITKGLTDAHLGSAMSSTMTEDLGPALQKVLRENLGPGLSEALKDEKFQRALGDTVHMISREMVLGANDAFTQIREGKPPGSSATVLDRLSSLAGEGAKLATTLTWLLGAVVLVLAAWIVKLMIQTKRYRGESEQRAVTTRLLTEAMKASEGKPWSDELLTALEHQFHADEISLLRAQAQQRGTQKKARISNAGVKDSNHHPH